MLLKIAPLFFSEPFMEAVVHPTIADLQSEFAAAGGRANRLRAQWRGYGAFWRVTLVAPFGSWVAQARNDGPIPSGHGAGPLAAASVLLVLLALTTALLGLAVAALTAAAAVLAMLIHAWYERHPSEMPAPVDRTWRSPQINFSSTEVAGNIGGLIFVVGSILVISLGLPSILWFLLAGAVAGSFLAWRLAAWHARHPKWGLPENRIVLR
jgi:hypothetical protein